MLPREIMRATVLVLLSALPLTLGASVERLADDDLALSDESHPHGCHMHNDTEACCLHVSSTHIIKFNDVLCLNATLERAPTFNEVCLQTLCCGAYLQLQENIQTLSAAPAACKLLPERCM